MCGDSMLEDLIVFLCKNFLKKKTEVLMSKIEIRDVKIMFFTFFSKRVLIF